MPVTRIFDLHCDTLTEAYKVSAGLCNSNLHLSLDRLPASFRQCQAMAVFMPDELRGTRAIEYFDCIYAFFLAEMHRHGALVTQVFSADEILPVLAQKPFAAMLTVEGGSVLAGRLDRVAWLYERGVRMMTLTWNAVNEICGGAATSLGFTDFGRAVVAKMEETGMIVDVSHLSDLGFWQLCEFAKKPFVASHSNARAVCGHARNLTDEMFLQIQERGGVVGLNYYKSFIRADGENGGINDLLRHVHHFLALGGENTLALGSDYDGADLPDYIDDIAKIENFVFALQRSGIPERVVHKILFQNAHRFFTQISGGNTNGLHQHTR